MGYYSRKIEHRRELICERADAALLLHAIINGDARWEWFDGSRDSGEVCTGGMRYTCKVDANGVPVLFEHLRTALLRNVTSDPKLNEDSPSILDAKGISEGNTESVEAVRKLRDEWDH